MKRVVILGGGISGLASGWFIKKRFGHAVHVTIVEKAPKLGGWIQTQKNQGFLFELGPHSCRTSGTGEDTLSLIKELGLDSQILYAEEAAHRRYLYHQKQLRLLPQGPLSLVRSPWIWKILPELISEYFRASQNMGEETIEEFIKRRFGKQVAEFLMDPLVSGIYAGDMSQLSMKACFPTFHKYEQEHGSVLKGLFKNATKSSLFTLKEGMGSLIKELHKQLEATFLLSNEALWLSFKGKQVEVQLKDRRIVADQLIAALPATDLAKLMERHDSYLAAKLREIPFASVASVQVGYKKDILPLQGFGYLIPRKERESILGMVWDSCIFPNQNHHKEETRLSVMMSLQDGQDSIQLAKDAIVKHLGIVEKPDHMSLHTAHHAIPQYFLGHEKRISEIEERVTRLFPHTTLLGSSYYGVSVNDCISVARRKVENFLEH